MPRRLEAVGGDSARLPRGTFHRHCAIARRDQIARGGEGDATHMVTFFNASVQRPPTSELGIIGVRRKGEYSHLIGQLLNTLAIFQAASPSPNSLLGSWLPRLNASRMARPIASLPCPESAAAPSHMSSVYSVCLSRMTEGLPA